MAIVSFWQFDTTTRNPDGFLDLIVKVETVNLVPKQFQGRYRVFTERTNDGVDFMGKDAIIIIPNYHEKAIPHE